MGCRVDCDAGEVVAGSVEIQIEGLGKLRRALRDAEQLEDREELRVGLRAAAEVVAADARGRIPSVSGLAKSSVRVVSSGNKTLVVGGKAKVPYYGWLDFGSRTPRQGNRRSRGPWSGSGQGPRKGRFIYPALAAKEREVVHLVQKAVDRALNRLGL